MTGSLPLIVTLVLNEEAFGFFEAQRKHYFPKERNFLQAHLTLFHHLPPGEPAILHDLVTWSGRTAPLQLKVSEVKSIGKGVAYKVESPELLQLHKTMQEEWQQWLKPQDKQKLWPHVTVQNKASPTAAKETLHLLQKAFQPFAARALGFSLWHYEGGPWRFEREYRFQN